MPLSWNEIKSRAMAFSREWGDAADEASQAKPFWIAFFEIFGITDKRVATFELNVRKLGTAHGFVDLFWPLQPTTVIDLTDEEPVLVRQGRGDPAKLGLSSTA